MKPYAITPGVGMVCRCKAKAGLRRSPWGIHTRTRMSLLRLNLDSWLNMTWFHSAAVQFPRARTLSKRRCRWVRVKGSTRNGRRETKYPSVWRLRMDRGAPSEDATFAWMAADEAVGCMHAFLTMRWFSRRIVCPWRPEPCLRVNDISRIHLSQILLTTQSEWPN
ncbi:uncharacterized protein TNCV_2111361 [Trichonephila clavipes]|nr:uncharacterized protein TNCV_2111361 [Trichonephila clavipes]